jgi:hypothetical protein
LDFIQALADQHYPAPHELPFHFFPPGHQYVSNNSINILLEPQIMSQAAMHEFWLSRAHLILMLFFRMQFSETGASMANFQPAMQIFSHGIKSRCKLFCSCKKWFFEVMHAGCVGPLSWTPI